MADEHTLVLDGHRFKFGLSDIVQAVVTILACVGLYFTLVGRTNQNSADIKNGVDERARLWAEVNRMNESGTRHSHEIDAGQQQAIDMLRSQLGELGHDMHELSPKVDKIDANVLWLMGKQLEKK